VVTGRIGDDGGTRVWRQWRKKSAAAATLELAGELWAGLVEAEQVVEELSCRRHPATSHCHSLRKRHDGAPWVALEGAADLAGEGLHGDESGMPATKRMCHYRKRGLCRAPRTDGKGRNPHGTTFAVRILLGRTAKGARRIFARQSPLPCALGKGNARHSSLSCAICDARQRKGVDSCSREMASHYLCRGSPRNKHGKEKCKK
jgi:hypothetical protein